MSRTADGMDGRADGSRCVNLWAIYQRIRNPPTTHAERAAWMTSAVATESSPADCTFGAPLVGRALQSLGAIDADVDVSRLPPAALEHVRLAAPAKFGPPVSLR